MRNDKANVIAPEIISGGCSAAGRNYRKLREANHFTQECVERMTGFDKSYLSKFESGQMNAGIETLMILAAAINVSVVSILDHELFTGVNELTEQARKGN